MVNDPEPVFKRLQDETNDGQPLTVLNDAVRAHSPTPLRGTDTCLVAHSVRPAQPARMHVAGEVTMYGNKN